jgi:hypothetical protein
MGPAEVKPSRLAAEEGFDVAADATAGAVGMDYNPAPCPTCFMTRKFPYPFADDEFDEVVGTHVGR